MPTEDEQQHSVNDISHLFLSNVRSLAGQGMPRPVRKPPGSQMSAQAGPNPTLPLVSQPPAPVNERYSGTDHTTGGTDEGGIPSVDLTPDELASVFGPSTGETARPAKNLAYAEETVARTATSSEATAIAPVTALLASHLGVRQLERARDYARHLAANGDRVGLIDLDASEFRLYCIDPAVEPGVESDSRQAAATGMCEPREIAEALEELNVDVDRWVLLLPHLRTPEAKALIRSCDRWTLLTTCDHDGVVSAYRTFKGVADAASRSIALGVTTLDAAGDAEAIRVQKKLAGVCRQFLSRQIAPESPVRYAAGVAEHPLMNCRVTRDKAQLASAPHWTVVSEMLARPRRGATTAAPAVTEPAVATRAPVAIAEPVAAQVAESISVEPPIRRVEPNEPTVAATPAPPKNSEAPMPRMTLTSDVPQNAMPDDEVIELNGDGSDASGVLSAVLHRRDLGLVECPLGVPGCPAGRLAVSRDRGLTLVAAASRGLTELRSIGKAFQWMLENRSLIAMAMPQFAIDAGKTPSILLLVDQADISGDLLRPMMQADHVSVRAYRTLRWGGRTGLLLEAA